MRHGSVFDRMADITQLLIKKPRTVNELSEVVDIDRKPVRKYLTAMEEHGLVSREEQPRGPNDEGTMAQLWRWTA